MQTVPVYGVDYPLWDGYYAAVLRFLVPEENTPFKRILWVFQMSLNH